MNMVIDDFDSLLCFETTVLFIRSCFSLINQSCTSIVLSFGNSDSSSLAHTFMYSFAYTSHKQREDMSSRFSILHEIDCFGSLNSLLATMRRRREKRKNRPDPHRSFYFFLSLIAFCRTYLAFIISYTFLPIKILKYKTTNMQRRFPSTNGTNRVKL